MLFSIRSRGKDVIPAMTSASLEQPGQRVSSWGRGIITSPGGAPSTNAETVASCEGIVIQ